MPLYINDLEQRVKKAFISNLIKNAKRNLTKEGKVEADMNINNTVLNEEQFEETVKLVKDNVTIEASIYRTMIFLVIKDTVDSNNQPIAIPCSNGYGTSGYANVRDINEDCYLLDGVEKCSLGSIPFSVKLSVPNSGGWKVDLPMPDKMVERYIAPFFRRQLKDYRQRYPKPRYEWHYFQILGCN